MTVVAIKQRISLFKPVIIFGSVRITFLLGCYVFYIRYQRKMVCKPFREILSNGVILLIFVVFISVRLRKKVNVFETFIEGAKQGFEIAVKNHSISRGDACRHQCICVLAAYSII